MQAATVAAQYAGGLQAGALASIYEPEVNLAVWEGGLDWSARLGAETLCRSRPGFTSNSRGHYDTAIADLQRRWPSDPALAPLLEAIATCARLFDELFEPPEIGLRVATLDRAMCPRFHVDRIPVRMIATFCGPGTEWLPNALVDRNRLGAREPGKPPATGAGIPEPVTPCSLSAGDVALMKGENWVGNEGNGLVHRSPAVAAHTPRLIATVDWLA